MMLSGKIPCSFSQLSLLDLLLRTNLLRHLFRLLLATVDIAYNYNFSSYIDFNWLESKTLMLRYLTSSMPAALNFENTRLIVLSVNPK